MSRFSKGVGLGCGLLLVVLALQLVIPRTQRVGLETVHPEDSVDGSLAAFSVLDDGSRLDLNVDAPVETGPGAFDLTAQLGLAAAVSDSEALVFAIDTSLSTWRNGPGNGGGCGGDYNGRNGPDDILDCELASVAATVEAIEGYGGVADLGVVLYFSTGVTTDVQPGAGVQGFTTPGADLDSSGVRDVETVLRSVRTGLFGACADEFT